MRRFRHLFEIENGKLSSIPAPGLAFRKNENAYYGAWASTIEEKVVDTYYQGASQGVSVRIAKGVTCLPDWQLARPQDRKEGK